MCGIVGNFSRSQVGDFRLRMRMDRRWFWLIVAMLAALSVCQAGGNLSVHFYKDTCPRVEKIIHEVCAEKIKAAPTTAGGTLRLFFHDCFVEGCDGSVLIAPSGKNDTEREAEINKSLAGDAFDVVIRAKKAVEEKCPGVVSCADVLAIVSRDLVVLTGGPSWPVTKGRRDGRVSNITQVEFNVPDASFKLDQLLHIFESKGLSKEDMVALTGAHTFGFSHCNEFQSRLYHFNKEATMDSSLDTEFANGLKQTCPRHGGDSNIVQPFDPMTPFTFDNLYYQSLSKHQGLLTSDQVLFDDNRTRALVQLYEKNQTSFFDAFVSGMRKLQDIEVKTGQDGELRNDCSKFNS